MEGGGRRKEKKKKKKKKKRRRSGKSMEKWGAAASHATPEATTGRPRWIKSVDRSQARATRNSVWIVLSHTESSVDGELYIHTTSKVPAMINLIDATNPTKCTPIFV
ncbi:hypothetical protein ACLOJK_031071 [Asimina triloba]